MAFEKYDNQNTRWHSNGYKIRIAKDCRINLGRNFLRSNNLFDDNIKFVDLYFDKGNNRIGFSFLNEEDASFNSIRIYGNGTKGSHTPYLSRKRFFSYYQIEWNKSFAFTVHKEQSTNLFYINLSDANESEA